MASLSWLLQVNDEASDKVLQVEQEYNLKRQPIYKERNQVISQMPDFWHLVFRGHDTLRPIITAEDEEGLAHLVEVGKLFPWPFLKTCMPVYCTVRFNWK